MPPSDIYRDCRRQMHEKEKDHGIQETQNKGNVYRLKRKTSFAQKNPKPNSNSESNTQKSLKVGKQVDI